MDITEIDQGTLNVIIRDFEWKGYASWLKHILFLAGIARCQHPDCEEATYPDKAHLSFHYDTVLNAKLTLEDEFMLKVRGNDNPYVLRLGRDPEDVDVDTLKAWVGSFFSRLVIDRDWRICEANLTHSHLKKRRICETVDGVWMCRHCREENMREPDAGNIYVFGSMEVDCYLFHAGEDKRAVWRRCKHLPFDVEQVHQIAADDQSGCTRALHEALRAKCKKNDWFSLSDAELDQIKAVKRFSDGAFLDGAGDPVALSGRED
jgi:hypothetical protein